MNTGQRIKLLREEKKVSQSELAKTLDLKTPTTISKWEGGENSPKLKDIVKLSEFFNVSSDYLLGIDENRTSKQIEENQKLKEDLDNLFAGKESTVKASLYTGNGLDEDELELIKEIAYKSILSIRENRGVK